MQLNIVNATNARERIHVYINMLLRNFNRQWSHEID